MIFKKILLLLLFKFSLNFTIKVDYKCFNFCEISLQQETTNITFLEIINNDDDENKSIEIKDIHLSKPFVLEYKSNKMEINITLISNRQTKILYQKQICNQEDNNEIKQKDNNNEEEEEVIEEENNICYENESYKILLDLNIQELITFSNINEILNPNQQREINLNIQPNINEWQKIYITKNGDGNGELLNINSEEILNKNITETQLIYNSPDIKYDETNYQLQIYEGDYLAYSEGKIIFKTCPEYCQNCLKNKTCYYKNDNSEIVNFINEQLINVINEEFIINNNKYYVEQFNEPQNCKKIIEFLNNNNEITDYTYSIYKQSDAIKYYLINTNIFKPIKLKDLSLCNENNIYIDKDYSIQTFKFFQPKFFLIPENEEKEFKYSDYYLEEKFIKDRIELNNYIEFTFTKNEEDNEEYGEFNSFDEKFTYNPKTDIIYQEEIYIFQIFNGINDGEKRNMHFKICPKYCYDCFVNRTCNSNYNFDDIKKEIIPRDTKRSIKEEIYDENNKYIIYTYNFFNESNEYLNDKYLDNCKNIFMHKKDLFQLHSIFLKLDMNKNIKNITICDTEGEEIITFDGTICNNKYDLFFDVDKKEFGIYKFSSIIRFIPRNLLFQINVNESLIKPIIHKDNSLDYFYFNFIEYQKLENTLTEQQGKLQIKKDENSYEDIIFNTDLTFEDNTKLYSQSFYYYQPKENEFYYSEKYYIGLYNGLTNSESNYAKITLFICPEYCYNCTIDNECWSNYTKKKMNDYMVYNENINITNMLNEKINLLYSDTIYIYQQENDKNLDLIKLKRAEQLIREKEPNAGKFILTVSINRDNDINFINIFSENGSFLSNITDLKSLTETYYYYNTTIPQIIRCHENCKSCDEGQSEYNCLSCFDNNPILTSINSCINIEKECLNTISLFRVDRENKEIICESDYQCKEEYFFKETYECLNECIDFKKDIELTCIKCEENQSQFYNLCIDKSNNEDFTNAIINNIKKYLNNKIDLNNFQYKVELYENQINDNQTLFVNLDHCEKELREYYKLKDNDIIYILKIINNNNEDIINSSSFSIITQSGMLLDLKYCNNTSIYISLPIQNLEIINFNKSLKLKNYGIDIYNKNDSFFIDKCYVSKFNDEKIDLSLKDRFEKYFLNIENLCDENCVYHKFDYEKKKITCECNSNYENYKKEIYNNNTYKYNFFTKYTCLDLVVCYNIIINFINMTNNISFHVFFSSIIVLICIAYYITFEKKKIENFLANKIIHNKSKIIKEKSKNNEKMTDSFSRNNLSSSIRDIKNSNHEINIEDLNKDLENIKNTKISVVNMNYEESLIKDKRSCIKIFYQTLFLKIHLISFFYYHSIITLNSLYILSIYFEIITFYFWNAMLFSSDRISKIYHNNGKLKIINQIIMPFIAFILTKLTCLLNLLSLHRENYERIALGSIIDNKDIKEKKLLAISTRFYNKIYLIIIPLIILFELYMLIINGSIYQYSQILVIMNLIFGIIIYIIYNLFISLIICLLRVNGLNNKDKCFFLFSKTLEKYF